MVRFALRRNILVRKGRTDWRDVRLEKDTLVRK